jgi:ferrochelatase
VKRAILLVNLGSPASPQPGDVKTYLDQFLMDEYVLDIPAALRALIVKGFILRSRPRHTPRCGWTRARRWS